MKTLVSAVGLLATTASLAIGAVRLVPQDYPSIQAGVDAATAGDSVVVAAGTYQELVRMKSDVTLLGAGMGQTILDARNVPRPYDVGVIHFSDGVGSASTVVAGLEAWSAPQYVGVYGKAGAQVEVIACRFRGGVVGVYFEHGAHVQVRECLLDHNYYGMQQDTSYGELTNCTLVENYRGVGLAFVGAQSIDHCIIANSGDTAVHCNPSVSVALTCSCLWGNAAGDYVNCVSGVNGQSGNIQLDPMFCSPVDGVYTLRPESPCAQQNNPGCGQLGAFGVGCGESPGACCFDDAACELLLLEECAAQGGSWTYGPPDCDPNPCTLTTGACCVSLSCIVTEAVDCGNQGGTFQGDGSDCDPNPCLSDDTGSILAWGFCGWGECSVPAPNSGFLAVGAGGSRSLGLRSDGSIAAWGRNLFGQNNPPPGANTGFTAVSGYDHTLGLKADSSIVAWGRNDFDQCNVPPPNADFVMIAGGYYHSLGLRSDGSVVAWGRNSDHECDVPVPNAGFVAIAAGQHNLGLKADGSVVAWGPNDAGQCTVPEPNSGFVAIAAGVEHSLGLKADGSILAWGLNDAGQTNVPTPNEGFVAIAGGAHHSIALRADGSIAVWGWNNQGQSEAPQPNSGFVAVAAGYEHSLGLIGAHLGACCFDSGLCVITTQGRCNDTKVWHGEGSDCMPSPCPPPTGACCLADGHCELQSGVECEASNGSYLGNGHACDPNPCPPPSGACCFYYDICLVMTEAECAGHQGSYQGNSVACDPEPCTTSSVGSGPLVGVSRGAVPNPSTGQVTIRFVLPTPSAVTVSIVDASGRVVRRIDEAQRAAGAHSIVWDGRDDGGLDVPSGVYFTRVETNAGASRGRVVLAR